MKQNIKSYLNEYARIMFECEDKIYYLSNEEYKENGILMDLDQILVYNKQTNKVSNLGCNMYVAWMTIDNYLEDELAKRNVVAISNEMHYVYRYNLSVNMEDRDQKVVDAYKNWCERNNVKYETIKDEFPDMPDVFKESSLEDKINAVKANKTDIEQKRSTVKHRDKEI